MQFEQGANPARVKAANQAAILKTIYHCGPIKRSEVAQRLGLTLPTITTNINSMMARGIVRETGSAPAGGRFVGRRAHPGPAISSEWRYRARGARSACWTTGAEPCIPENTQEKRGTIAEIWSWLGT